MSEPQGGDDGALPTFIIIGAMKSGTTSLASYLSAHPDVFMTTPKEPEFFSGENTTEGLDWYRSLFAAGAQARARGEASTDYTKAARPPGVAGAIAHVLPDVRLLYLLRDPIERIRSHYDHVVRTNIEHRPIDQAVTEDPHYVNVSRYTFQLGLYLEHFDPSQILVLWSDDLKKRRADTVARALSFIGVDPDLGLARATLAQEHHTTHSAREPSRLHEPARRVARFTPLRWLDPETKRRMYKRTERRAKTRTVIGPEARAHLVEQLVPDSTRLAALVGETPPWLAAARVDGERMSLPPDGAEGALPTFLVIGAMKSGTSSLHRYLDAHPDVFMAFPKEPRYFATGHDTNYHRGIDWYRALFAEGASHLARGEASTHYTKAPQFSGVPERIAQAVPDVRLVYVVRDPIDRIRSQYTFLVRRNNEQRPIEQVVVDDARYVDWSKYAFQLELYLEHFDRSQILVLWSDDLMHQRAETFSRVLSFIGVDPDVDRVRKVLAKEFHRTDDRREPTSLHAPARRVAAYTPLRFLPPDIKLRVSRMARKRAQPVDNTLSPATEARLWAQIADDNRRLEALVGEAPPWIERRDAPAPPATR